MEEVLSNQVAFDKVVKHLMDQGAKAKTTNGGCVYHHVGTDRKCAIGCLMTNDECALAEGFGGIAGITGNGLLPVRLGHLDQRLLGALQNVHDDCPVESWFQKLAEVAVKHNLAMPRVDHA